MKIKVMPEDRWKINIMQVLPALVLGDCRQEGLLMGKLGKTPLISKPQSPPL